MRRWVVKLEVNDAKEATLELRASFSVRNSTAAIDLAALVREQLIAFIRLELPGSLPRRRNATCDAESVPRMGRTHSTNRPRLGDARRVHFLC